MNRIKTTIGFSIVCTLLVLVVNSMSFLVIEVLPYSFNEYSYFDIMGVGLLYGILVFLLVLIGGIKFSNIYIPFIYLAFSLYLLNRNMLYGYDFIFHLNFSFSLLSSIIYETIGNFDLLPNNIIDLIVFNTIFFLYQFILLLISKKVFFHLKSRWNNISN